ncbi:hypothetical protein JCM33374_g3243 [Metschnikowia sp. JCM 33374]|nr:hypothetical protein JCM33374_g3243 [Metschnikowia sp. JCM 33374]
MKLSSPLLLLSMFVSLAITIPTSSEFVTNKGITTGENHRVPPRSMETQYIRFPPNLVFPTTLVEGMLEEIIQRLKSFLSWEMFDFVQFRYAINVLKEKVEYMRSIVHEYRQFDTIIGQKFKYTQNMFRMMVDAAELMDFYTAQYTVEQALIFKTIQLNAQLLILHDSCGMPNTSLPGFTQTVARVKQSLNYWREVFNNVTENSPALLLVFSSEYTKASRTILVLQSHVKGGD